MKITAILLFFLALSGCAGTYEPSETYLAMRGKITRPQAVVILQEMSKRTDAEAVVCQLGAGYGVDENSRLKFTGDGFSYQAYTKGRFVRETAGVQYFEKDYFEKSIPFGDIDTVRILPYQGTECQTAKFEKSDYIIALQDNPFRVALSIVVKKNELDKYLAAIAALTDNPRIVQGDGL